MKKQVLIMVALGSIMCFTGCQNTVNTIPGVVQPITLSDYVGINKPVLTDYFLTGRLQVIDISVGKTSEGFSKVQVLAKNTRTGIFSQFWSWMTGENPYPVDYKFSWFDQDGIAVSSQLSLWKKQMIYPGEIITFTSVSPNKESAKFHLNVKESE